MRFRTIVDGYNVLFSSPWLQRGRGPGWLEQARGRLVRGLAHCLDERARAETQIVFDARQAPPEGPREQSFSGLTVTFAVGYDQADDLLEQLIRRHPQPKLLTVVSSDLRIQRCARACRANWVGSPEWLQPLLEPASEGAVSPPSAVMDKQVLLAEDALLSSAEVASWLREFAGAHDGFTARGLHQLNQPDSAAQPGRTAQATARSQPAVADKRTTVDKPAAQAPTKTAKTTQQGVEKTVEKLGPETAEKTGKPQKQDPVAARKRARQQLEHEIPPLDEHEHEHER
jgi:uncharacterized protein